MEDNKILIYKSRVYVPNSGELRKLIMNEMHNVEYVGNVRHQKTIAPVRSPYFYLGMKRDIVEYIMCIEFQRLKVEHRHPTRLLQPLVYVN